MQCGRIVYTPEKQEKTLLPDQFNQIKEEIRCLLSNKDTLIGRQKAQILHDYMLPNSAGFVLSGIDKIENGMHKEVKDHLGDRFSLVLQAGTLPLLGANGNGMGRAMQVVIQYNENVKYTSVTRLWVLFVIGLYITLGVSCIANAYEAHLTVGWTTFIVESILSTMVMYGIVRFIKSVPKLNLVYELYFVDIPPMFHIIIGLIGCLGYCFVIFLLHTWKDDSMFGVLNRL